jgi:hypothetical protein
MRRTWLPGFITLSLLSALLLIGCDQRPVVPTVAIEPTQPVVVVVVTATSQPTLAPTSTSEPTITPLPTFSPQAPITVTATIAVPTVSVATAPPVTPVSVQPTVQQIPTAETPSATAVPANFAAPNAVAPAGIFIAPSDTVLFKFTSVGPLAPDQCYRFTMTLSYPGDPNFVSDYWVPQVLCGNQATAGQELEFILKQARFRDEPNFGGLLNNAETQVPPSDRYDMRWWVDVVRIVDATDQIHPTVEALSPASAQLSNTFSR